jgi:hypothetical protein
LIWFIQWIPSMKLCTMCNCHLLYRIDHDVHIVGAWGSNCYKWVDLWGWRVENYQRTLLYTCSLFDRFGILYNIWLSILHSCKLLCIYNSDIDHIDAESFLHLFLSAQSTFCNLYVCLLMVSHPYHAVHIM